MDIKQTHTEGAYEDLAIDTIRLNAINERVSTVRRSFENKAEKVVVRSMYKTGLRVAAVIVILIGSASLYKFMATNDQSVYNKLFVSYELTNTRGQQTRERETEAYRNGNWKEVVAIYHSGENKSVKNTFLAAISEMQMNHFPEAVQLFEGIVKVKSEDHVFQEETEYYLSLAYLMNHEELKGMRLMNKIKSDRNHTYYPLVSGLSGIDVRIIELKNANK